MAPVKCSTLWSTPCNYKEASETRRPRVDICAKCVKQSDHALKLLSANYKVL